MFVESDAQAEIMSPVSNRKRNLVEREDSISQKTACMKFHVNNKNILLKKPRKKAISSKIFCEGKLEFWNGNYQKAEMLLQNALNLHNTVHGIRLLRETLLKLGKSDEARNL